MSSRISFRTPRMSRRRFSGGLAAVLACSSAAQLRASRRPVSFGVFSLFEPQEMLVKAEEPMLLTCDDRRYVLSPDTPAVCIGRAEGCVTVALGDQRFPATHLRATAASGGAAAFLLTVPPSSEHSPIRRAFLGSFDLRVAEHHLQPVVSMDLETAVASIVNAESPADAPQAFVMAQAVAARSFLVAVRSAHTGFDFCDTTHCQFLGGLVRAGSAANLGARRTAGLCLSFEGHLLGAMYSRSCSGRTCSLAELGLPVRGYPYYPVNCELCLHHPERWEREWDRPDSPRSERERIAFNRIHGWSAIPSDSFTHRGTLIEGRGIGHGLGLCQRGAVAMARSGIEFDRILAHYYANTALAVA